MTRSLGPRFQKVVALMRSTTHQGEIANAEARAEAMAKACGRTLEQALAEMDQPEAPPRSPQPSVQPSPGSDDLVRDMQDAREATRRKFLRAIRDNPKAGHHRLAELLDCPTWLVRRLLAEVKSKGLADNATDGTWRVSAKGVRELE